MGDELFHSHRSVDHFGHDLFGDLYSRLIFSSAFEHCLLFYFDFADSICVFCCGMVDKNKPSKVGRAIAGVLLAVGLNLFLTILFFKDNSHIQFNIDANDQRELLISFATLSLPLILAMQVYFAKRRG